MGEIERTKSSWVGKDKVLVQAANSAIRSDYYIVDLKENIVRKLPGILWNHGLSGTTVALDTVVYAIGSGEGHGLHKQFIPKAVDINPDVEHIHSLTSVLKLTESESKWKEFINMNYERESPDCATLGNKIYAFGGSYGDTPIAEVYDTEIGKWEVITPPPTPTTTDDDGRDWDWRTHGTPVLSDTKNNRLLVHFGIAGPLYAYYPNNNNNNNKWECLDRKMQGIGYISALVDDVIYSFRPLGKSVSIVAYDIPTKKWLKVLLSSSFRDPSMNLYSMEHMFHLGNGMLCLANSCPLFAGTKRLDKTLFQFVRFSVERIDPGLVRVTHASVHILPVYDCCSAACFVPL